MKTTLFWFSFFTCFTLNAQDISVPDSIKNELKTLEITCDSSTFTFKIAYPKNYNPNKKYPILLALSGGNQSSEIVDFCYAVWFRSSYFDKYITILPVNTNKKNMSKYTTHDIQLVYQSIQENFKTKKNKWILAGTSNGGVAAFNFLAVQPMLFEGVIAMPGNVGEDILPIEEWNHLKIVLAIGEKDEETWKTATEKSKLKIETFVKSVLVFTMLGQEHILSWEYTIDEVYKRYFEKKSLK